MLLQVHVLQYLESSGEMILERVHMRIRTRRAVVTKLRHGGLTLDFDGCDGEGKQWVWSLARDYDWCFLPVVGLALWQTERLLTFFLFAKHYLLHIWPATPVTMTRQLSKKLAQGCCEWNSAFALVIWSPREKKEHETSGNYNSAIQKAENWEKSLFAQRGVGRRRETAQWCHKPCHSTRTQ